jgi:hypothetical protein
MIKAGTKGPKERGTEESRLSTKSWKLGAEKLPFRSLFPDSSHHSFNRSLHLFVPSFPAVLSTNHYPLNTEFRPTPPYPKTPPPHTFRTPPPMPFCETVKL